ncbi:hypothetical protein QQX98_007173 [Neonectria punicea]|uniref:Uncharacterized protein n=1 Tax=Neonectria punicea TaxID=979145 RepID=A0ABR1GYU7_9HYPO
MKTLQLYEPPDSFTLLRRNGFVFRIAFTFTSSTGAIVTNVVWKSLPLQPRMEINWQDGFALNWTSTYPQDPSDPIHLNGTWQSCRASEVFDLDADGYWVPSASIAKDGYMTVGKNSYKNPNGAGIYIVVGVQAKGKDDFEAVFVDTLQLGVNMSAWIRVSESLNWWLEAGLEACATAIPMPDNHANGVRTPPERFNMLEPENLNYVLTSYDYANGVWTTSKTRPTLVELETMTGVKGIGIGPNPYGIDKPARRMTSYYDRVKVFAIVAAVVMIIWGTRGDVSKSS